MGFIEIWLSRRGQRSLGHARFGHVELQVGDQVRGFFENEDAEPLTPPSTLGLYEIFPGRVRSRTAQDLALEAERTYRRQYELRPDIVRPPEAVIFTKEIPDDQEQHIEQLLMAAIQRPPNYCMTSVPNTLNCVTFALGVLTTAKVLPTDFSLTGRSYSPDNFYEGMTQLWDQGFFVKRREVVLVDSTWQPKPPFGV